MKKRIVRIIAVLALIAAAVYGVRRYQGAGESEATGALRIYGSIDIRAANLAFADQERIVAVLAEEGDRVQPGQILARQKTDRIEAAIAETKARIGAQQEVVKRLTAGSRPQEIEQARAEVTAARVRVRNGQQVLERLRQTSGTGATSEQDLDDARSRLEVEQAQLTVREKALDLLLEGPRAEDIAAAELQLQALQASLSLLLVRLADSTLSAPAAGVIQSRILEPGEMAGPARPVFTLALTDPKWVRAYVPEPDLGRIRPGMKARVLSDSFPDESLTGWVGFLSPTAEFTPRTVQTEDLRTQLVYEARVLVTDERDRLRLGMPVTVIIDREAPAGDSAESTAPPPPADGAPQRP